MLELVSGFRLPRRQKLVGMGREETRSVQPVDGRDERWIRGGANERFQERILHVEETRLAQVRTAVRRSDRWTAFLNFGRSSLFQKELARLPSFTGFVGAGKRQPHARPR